jgi:hypothetical protein
LPGRLISGLPVAVRVYCWKTMHVVYHAATTAVVSPSVV